MICAKTTKKEARHLLDEREEKIHSKDDAKKLAVEIMKEQNAESVLRVDQSGYTCGVCGCSGQIWFVVFNNGATYEYYTTDIYGNYLKYAFIDLYKPVR